MVRTLLLALAGALAVPMGPLVAAGLAHAAGPQVAQGRALPSLRAHRLVESGETIEVDGVLAEPVWSAVPAATDFRQREPLEGEPATEATEVRVVYDRHALYVGVLARDRQPERILARILQRDKLMELSFEQKPQFAGDDAVAILLDPFDDHRNAMVFATNANGAEFDALITDEGREFNIDWRAVWEVAAQRVPEGWSAEFAIPFRTLRYPSGGGDRPWGFNVYRVIRRKNEEVLWSAWSRDNEGFQRVSRAGHVEGMAELPRAGLNLEVKPFVLSGAAREYGAGGVASATEGRLDAGLDLKYEVKPGLVLDLTANTDFAQVEVDDEQVNLTRFDLFFPEKRDFFLENAGIFEFGLRGFAGFEPPPFLLFFSRSIGIAEDGEVPLLGGARLTGRVGGQTVGLLDVVTGRANGEPRTNFAVARIKRDIGVSNYAGLMLVDRRDAESSNTGVGADGSFWPGPALNVQGFAARTFTSDAGGEGGAYRLAVDYQKDRAGFNVAHLAIDPETSAEMGFITRTDMRRTEMFSRLTARPPVLGLRRADLFLGSQYVSRTDGRLQDRVLGPGVGFTWNSGETLFSFVDRAFIRVEEAFELADEAEIAVGDYQGWFYGLFANTSPARPVALGVDMLLQRMFAGRIRTITGRVTAAPGSHLALRLQYTRSAVDVPSGRFDADLASVRVGYAFSTRLTANALIQYNRLDNEISANVRVNLIHRPGSDLFIVFNEVRGAASSLWDPSARGAVVKVTYLLRL
ncbi:MAG: carbohydrate binding family 9 domain-containing protein [Gemmatimonadetes bacterium]|nr:carbohydrate binding family 9 domain-containing protein [Gemmatimonadota bacterium]